MASELQGNQTRMVEHQIVPFFIPTQMDVNICSHCAPYSRSSETCAFYTYPCNKEHLAHEQCVMNYLTSEKWKEGCELCVKEFGMPVPIQEQQLSFHKKQNRVKLLVSCFTCLLALAGVALALSYFYIRG